MENFPKSERQFPEFTETLPSNLKQFRFETQFNLLKKFTGDPRAAAILVLALKIEDLWDVIANWER